MQKPATFSPLQAHSSGVGGIRTHVPVARQPDFESGSL